jgi:ABC-type bacteriocin/lantibiotic exporter with double-glycine peptidase domain
MDEATSSLDPQTEADIYHDLLNEQGDLTIIAITHRGTIAQLCDRMYRIERGQIVLSEDHDPPARQLHAP